MILVYFKRFFRYIITRRCPRFVSNCLLWLTDIGVSVKMYGGYTAAEHINENCELFLNKEQLNDRELMKRIRKDIMYCYVRYGTNANEFFSYHFLEKNSKERDTYLPRLTKDRMLVSQMRGKNRIFFEQIKNKYKFYEIAYTFFKRDVCRIMTNEDLTPFLAFSKKHTKFIAKPISGHCGNGVEIISIDTFEGDAKKVFAYLHQTETSSYIVEELVEQDSRMAEWNISSLNTIRVPSMRTSWGVTIFYPSIRIGRAGSIIDNAGAGGTFAAIDPKTGIIISNGYDKRGHSFAEHPDSHKPYMGSQIPDWDALINDVKDLHAIMAKEHKYIAFDMALSTKGWVVVEANWGELSMPQIEFGKGLKTEFKELLMS